MIMSAAGVDDFAQRSGQPVNINRFRANFIVSGCPAFDEDTWAEIWIGDVMFKNMKPCQRCSNTLVDPMSGKKHEQFEPLKTLNKCVVFEHAASSFKSHHKIVLQTCVYCRYRSVCKDFPGRGIYGALLGLASSEGHVSVGDPVYVIRKFSASLW